MGRTPFKLNFGRYSWKEDLMVQTGILRVEEFLMGLQKSWEQITKSNGRSTEKYEEAV